MNKENKCEVQMVDIYDIENYNEIIKFLSEKNLVEIVLPERDSNGVKYINSEDLVLEKVSIDKIKKIKFHAKEISKYAKELEFMDEEDD